MQATTLKQNRRTTERRVFDSVQELIEHALARDPQSTKNRRQLAGGVGLTHYMDNRNVGRTFADASDLRQKAGDRWAEGLELVESMVRDIEDATMPAPWCRRRRTRFSDVDGAELDLDRLRAGQDFWRTTHRENVAAPANLTLCVDVAANWNRKPAELIWRGVAAIVLCERLEAAGYRVELWAYEAGSGCYTDGADDLVAVRLKGLSDTLDRSTLVNAVSGWFFRTVVFAELSQSHDGRKLECGYGSHRLPDAAELQEVTHDADAVIVQELWDRQAAVGFVRHTLQRFAN